MKTLKHIMFHIAQVAPDLVISGLLILFYLSNTYATYAPTLQTIALKITLVSIGFLHANIINKISFPAIDWANADSDRTDKVRATVLYAVIIYAYAMGG